MIFVAASYCFDLPKWTCPFCRIARNMGYEYSNTVSNPATNTFGIMAINKDAKEIVSRFEEPLT